MVWYPATLLPGASTLLPDVQQLRWHELYLQYTALIEGQLETFLKEEGVPVAAMLSAATSDDSGAYTCIDYLVACTEYGAFLCGKQGLYGRPARPKRLIGRGWPKLRVACGTSWR